MATTYPLKEIYTCGLSTFWAFLSISHFFSYPFLLSFLFYFLANDEKTYENGAVFFAPFLEQFFDSHEVWGLEGAKGELLATALVARAHSKVR